VLPLGPPSMGRGRGAPVWAPWRRGAARSGVAGPPSRRDSALTEPSSRRPDRDRPSMSPGHRL